MKMEDLTDLSVSFSDHVLSSYTLTGGGDVDQKSSFGFMELLALQDFGPFVFDDMILQPSDDVITTSAADLKPKTTAVVGMSYNLPATPNTSSISSVSSEAANEQEQGKAANEEEEQQNKKTKKELKPKKTNQKKQRDPRFTFMTKSEVDHLEDGYRWRKYGQKAVKNSPFPRSYYRCTTVTCGVKKRVERSCTDPTIVMTTYEGQHTHLSPIMPRGNNVAGIFPDSAIFPSGATTFAMPTQMTLSHLQQQQPPFVHNLSSLNFGYGGGQHPEFVHDQRRFCSTDQSGFLRDHGLLQDIVPSFMSKEEN